MKLLNEEGYTLIELLTVITIIAILGSIALPHYLGYRDKAKMTTVYATLHQIRLAQELYKIDNEVYFSFSEPLTSDTSPEIPELDITISIPIGQKYLITATNDLENKIYSYHVLIETDFDRNLDGKKDLYQFSHDQTGETPFPLSPLAI